MTSRKRPGILRGLLAALGRGLLGKASDAYMRQFNGADDPGGGVREPRPPQKAPALPGNRPRETRKPAPVPGPILPRAPRRAPPPEYEPVHGLTVRQLDDYLARNPGYRSAYEEESRRRREASASPVTTPSVRVGLL